MVAFDDPLSWVVFYVFAAALCSIVVMSELWLVTDYHVLPRVYWGAGTPRRVRALLTLLFPATALLSPPWIFAVAVLRALRGARDLVNQVRDAG